MRGNGAVTVGESIEQAVVFTWYLEEAARLRTRGSWVQILRGTPKKARTYER